MAQTESTMPALGLAAADFHLPDVVSGATVGLDSFAGKRALLVMFISRHCPYVQHVKHELARLGKDYAGEALGIVAISPNYVVQYPDDAPELLKEMAAELGLNYPICYDETQEAAKAYDAACTPDFFLFDAQRRLVYRGQLDGARPRNDVPVTGADLRAAIDAVLGGEPVNPQQRPSVGCNIKWKPEAPRRQHPTRDVDVRGGERARGRPGESRYAPFGSWRRWSTLQHRDNRIARSPPRLFARSASPPSRAANSSCPSLRFLGHLNFGGRSGEERQERLPRHGADGTLDPAGRQRTVRRRQLGQGLLFGRWQRPSVRASR